MARKRRVGQRTWRRSVACGEKTPPGSRKPVAECGLWRENAAWVKKAGGAVWLVARKRRLGQESRWRSVACGEKTLRGSRRPVAECGQEGRRCSVACGEKTPRGSKDLAAECGLGERICRVNQRTWRRSVVKKAGDAVWLVARKRRLGQESQWCSVV